MKNNQMTLLNYLENQTRLKDDLHISYDELAEWPADQIEAAKRQGCLVQIDDAEGIICQQCPKHCWNDVEIRQKNGQKIGVYFCEDEDCAGLIEIEIEKLQQWKIDKKKLWQILYGFESEWQMPWDDNNKEYITLQEAVNLANVDSITVKNMSRLLEDPECPVHRMRKGRRCKVHLNDFRKWFEYAKHGKITDAAIEKYNEGTKKRIETARKKKIELKTPKPNKRG